LNFWEDPFDENGWSVNRNQDGYGSFNGIDFTYDESLEETYHFSGINFNLGMLWNINAVFTLGGVYKAPFKADLTHDYDQTYEWIFPGQPDQNQLGEISYSEEEEIEMPMSYGLGLAARLNDSFSLSFDMYRTEWGDYILHTSDGREISPITGKEKDDSDIDATTQIRMGGEYLIIGKASVIPLRSGLFYDPEPAPGEPDDFWGISMGSGISFGNIVFDIAYQFRFAEDVRSVVVGADDADQDVEQHTLYMSLIYYF